MSAPAVANSVDPNRPIDAEGRVHHLQVSAAEVAPRILSVGDVGRAERIARLLDEGTHARVVSSRGFVTHTGTFEGTRVSIIATGMGTAMMDFVVREARAVVAGPMAILRFGTAGGLRHTAAGTIAVASKGAVLVRREPDWVTARLEKRGDDDGSFCAQALGGMPYSVTGVAPAHAGLAALVREPARSRATPADVAALTCKDAAHAYICATRARRPPLRSTPPVCTRA